jgi:hypothetical protein
VIVVDMSPARRLLLHLWKLNRPFAISMAALYLLLLALVLGLALGGYYASTKIQDHGSVVVAGVVALGSFAVAEELGRRRAKPVLDNMLQAALHWAERVDEANRRSRESRGAA